MELLTIIPTADVIDRHPRFTEWLDDKRISWSTFADHMFALPLSQFNREGLDVDSWDYLVTPGKPTSIETGYSMELADDVIHSLLQRATLLDDVPDEGDHYGDDHPTAYAVCFPVIHDLLEYVLSYLPAMIRDHPKTANFTYHPSMLTIRRGIGFDLVLAVEYYSTY